MIKSEGNKQTQHCFIACFPGEYCKCKQQIINQKYNMTRLEQLQEEMCDLLGEQLTQISLMSKIELGDDVIQEIQRLQNEIKELKNE